MSDAIITVENLGKRYRIAHQQQSSKTLREALTNAGRGLVRGLVPNGKRSGENVAAQKSEEFWALRNVSFEVKQGEVVGFIGRNGAGKSTLLKLLSRISEPTEGRIHLRGRVASLLEVGTGFHPELTGRENIFLNGAILGMRREEIKRKFDEIVDFAGTEKFLDTPVKRYSSGMYVRLAFAVAAHLEPEILVVDEVLAVGDTEFQKKCLGKMEEVSRGGRTVLFVSHNTLVVQKLCTRAVLLNQGTLLMDGSAVDAIELYQRESPGSSLLFGRTINLEEVRRWGGNGKAKLASVKVYAPGDLLSEERPVRQGQVGFAISVHGDISAVKAAGVTIYDLYDRKIVNCNTLQLRREVSLNDPSDTICIVIDDLRLRPGLYKVGLWLGGRDEEHVDAIVVGLSLDILPEKDQHWISEHEGVYECSFGFNVVSHSVRGRETGDDDA